VSRGPGAWARLRAPIALAAVVLATVPAAVEAQDPLAGFDTYVAEAVRDWGIAGLSIAVVKDDSVVFARGYGVREVGGSATVDEHTIFAIGSNTKLFTAVAAGMLVDEGKLDWGDRAIDRLPGFQLHDPYVTREMRLDDLMSHRSGLGRRGDALWYGTEFTRGEVLERIRHLEPNSSFRSAYGYQNIMFLAAGEIVARAAGASWDDVIRRRIFRPLGMDASSTTTLHLPAGGNVASPHQRIDDRLVPVPWRNIDNIAPAGSINASALDMTRWLRFLLADGQVGDERLIEPATLARIERPHTLLPFAPDSLVPSTHFMAYGLGIVTMDYLSAKVLWHTGGIDGMLSLTAYVPEHDLALVVLTNTTGRNNLFTALQYRVLDAYLGGSERDWSRIYLDRTLEAEARAAEAQAQVEASRISGTSPSLSLDGYAGRYTHAMYGEAVVRHTDGRLRLGYGPAFQGTLEHWHHDVFRVRWDDPTGGQVFVRFSLDAAGDVAIVDVDGVAEFRRVDDVSGGGR
jgi:CubicO group peptidase (beta-lactamase class C family)